MNDSITVTSASLTPEQVQAQLEEFDKAGKPEQSQSAPADDAEQKEAPVSDTEETEEEKEGEDEDSESEADDAKDQEDDSEKEKPKRRKGIQRRVDKLNARIAARERELEYWKAEALKKGASGQEKENADSEPKSDDSGKPNPDDFENHAEYVEALTDWKVEQKAKALEEKQQKSKLLSEQEKLIQAHSERVKSFAETTEDFQDVLESVDDVPVSATVQELLVTSENGPELMYELAKNREEFERINKLSPLAAAREMGRIESHLSSKASEKKEPSKKPTRAPRPITPIGSGGKGTVGKSLDDPNISQAEFERIREKQLSERWA